MADSHALSRQAEGVRRSGAVMQVCTTAGCPRLVQRGRCAPCRAEREQARGTRQQRGYDAEYDARRRADLAALNRGEVLTCWRCTRVVLPHEYSLGHCDDNRTIIHGAEHLLACNLANTRGGCTHPDHS